MGVKRDPAVRLCVVCGLLKPADQFAPRRRKCVACQAKQGHHLDDANKQSGEAAAIYTRARDRALRRLAAEHVDTYRQVKAQRLAAVPAALPRQRAQGRAASQALSELGRRYPKRYRTLYEQELARARSEPLPVRRGRPPGAPDRLSLASASAAATWQREGPAAGRANRPTQGARRRAEREAVRLRAAELFQLGRSTTLVAAELGVARQTAVSWQARWREGGAAALRSRGPSRHPAIADSKLPAIERALLEGAEAHGFDGEVWTSARVAVVIQRITGVRPGSKAVQRLLRERLGWRFQSATSDATVVAASAPPPPTPASATDSLAAVADAALAGLDSRPAGKPGLAPSIRPASSTERRDAIAQAWREEPGITPAALAKRFGVSGRTIQRDTQALGQRGIQQRAADRRRQSQQTRAQYAAIYRRFVAWLADELGRPPTGQDLSGEVLGRWIAQRASGGGHGRRGLSSASLRLECSALRELVRQAGRPELARVRQPAQRPPNAWMAAIPDVGSLP